MSFRGHKLSDAEAQAQVNPTLTRAELAELLPELPGWELGEKGLGLSLSRSFEIRYLHEPQLFLSYLGPFTTSPGEELIVKLGYGRLEIELSSLPDAFPEAGLLSLQGLSLEVAKNRRPRRRKPAALAEARP